MHACYLYDAVRRSSLLCLQQETRLVCMTHSIEKTTRNQPAHLRLQSAHFTEPLEVFAMIQLCMLFYILPL